jgi:hypothetical protein
MLVESISAALDADLFRAFFKAVAKRDNGTTNSSLSILMGGMEPGLLNDNYKLYRRT